LGCDPGPCGHGFLPFVVGRRLLRKARRPDLRRYIASLMTFFTALIGDRGFEALLFAMLGASSTGWPGAAATLWAEHGSTLLLLAAVLLGSTRLVALQTMLKHQALAGNFPMRLRWNFHRLMLGRAWPSTRTSSPAAWPPR
jgi:ATP-binding cassette subfamily B multidrug efflux pump